jgi:hypothetical protein
MEDHHNHHNHNRRHHQHQRFKGDSCNLDGFSGDVRTGGLDIG